MRISEIQRKIIGETTARHFGRNVRVYLFGSRVFPDKKGGDIDLLLEGVPHPMATLKKKIELVVDLKKQLGDQKIDVVIKTGSGQFMASGSKGFLEIIEKEKVRLC